MDPTIFDALTGRLTTFRSRRMALPVVAGGVLGVLGAREPLAAKKNNKKKTKKFCQDGETVKAKNKKKKQRLRKDGATSGACPTCPDLQNADDLAAAIAAATPGATLWLCPGTFRLTSTLIVEQALTLIGAGTDQTIFDGGDSVRVLHIESGNAVTVQDLTITRGLAPEEADRGGGILNEGELTLRGVAVTASNAGLGGGIFNQVSSLRLETESRFAGNSASSGGGIFSQLGKLTLAATSSVTGNQASNGAGLFIQGATATLESGSSVAENDASANGGGIFMQDGTVTVETGSSVRENDASANGGGIFMQGGTLTLQTGSSVANNTADSGSGGGIFRQGGLGTVILDPGSIITDNSPDDCEPDQGTCT